MTKYTTKQADGTYRTVDTDHDSALSIIFEILLDWLESPAKKKKKKIKKVIKRKKFDWNVVHAIIIIGILVIILTMFMNGAIQW